MNGVVSRTSWGVEYRAPTPRARQIETWVNIEIHLHPASIAISPGEEFDQRHQPQANVGHKPSRTPGLVRYLNVQTR
jgi:hypothetical protein